MSLRSKLIAIVSTLILLFCGTLGYLYIDKSVNGMKLARMTFFDETLNMRMVHFGELSFEWFRDQKKRENFFEALKSLYQYDYEEAFKIADLYEKNEREIMEWHRIRKLAIEHISQTTNWDSLNDVTQRSEMEAYLDTFHKGVQLYDVYDLTDEKYEERLKRIEANKELYFAVGKWIFATGRASSVEIYQVDEKNQDIGYRVARFDSFSYDNDELGLGQIEVLANDPYHVDSKSTNRQMVNLKQESFVFPIKEYSNGHFFTYNIPIYSSLELPNDFRQIKWQVRFTYWTTSIADTIRDAYLKSISMVVGMMVIGILVAWWFILRVTKPLNQVVEACDRISTGDWQEPQFEKRDDEIGVLQQTFEKMVSRVKYDEIEARAMMLARQRELLEQQNIGLITIKEGIQKGSRLLKHALLHEVGLIAIVLQNVQMEAIEQLSEELKEDIDTLQRRQQRLSQLIHRINLMTSDVHIVPEMINMPEWLKHVVREMESVFEKKRIHVAFSGDEQGSLWADPVHVGEAVMNAIRNSVDAMTGDERKLELKWESTFDGSGRITISDNGAGIPADVLPHVSELFFTTKNGTNNFGLGVYYIDQIMQRHGGQLEIKSEEGKGTSLTMTFPAYEILTENENHAGK